ncbi:MAG TPA: hypothetical protein VFB58_04925 [Chloroflexota bacterium]|nr:hypothetical protein [Chloroflexota bacterium]
MLILGAAGAASGAAPAQPRVVHFLVPQRYVDLPRVYRDTVVWSATNCDFHKPCDVDLYTSPVHPFHPRVIAVNRPPDYNLFNGVVMSRHWLVWEEGGYTWQLWAMNRGTGGHFLVDSSKTSGHPPYDWATPTWALEGDTVVWAVTTCLAHCVTSPNGAGHWVSSIRMKRLPGGRTTTLYTTQAPCNQAWPAIAPHIRFAVWMQEGTCPSRVDGGPPTYNVNGTDLLIEHFPAGRVTQLTTNHLSSVPTTNGRYIAWKEAPDRFAPGAIWLLDLKTGATVMVSRRAKHDPKDPSAACRAGPGQPWTQCDYSPTLLQDSLVWYAHSSSRIDAYGLTSHRVYILDKGRVYAGPMYPEGSADGNYAVWQWNDNLTNPPPGVWPIKHYIAVARPPN